MWAGRAARVSLLALLGCSRPAAADGAARSSPVPSLLSASPRAGASVFPRPASAPSWVEALRSERWQAALAAIDALPAATRERPELRYSAAVAAERVGDAVRVLALLEGLESKLPLLAERICERRARAALDAGNAADAAAYFDKQPELAARLLSARAWWRSGQRKRALDTVEALLRKIPAKALVCELEAPARALLAELARPGAPARAARELRWIALEAPLCAEGDAAATALSALGARQQLTPAERLRRARAFADAGAVDELEAELALLPKSGRAAPKAGEATYLRGWARYNARTELAQAAELFAAAAKADPARGAELTFYAGRALTRAGATELAIAAFQRVLKQYARSSFADAAEYQHAQLLYESGRFPDAAKAYDAYLARYGEHGRHREDAVDERAIAWLVSGRAEDAVRSFEDIARKARQPHEQARYQELGGVAMQRAGRLDDAKRRFLEVARDHPLSFAALAASSRLEALGASVPVFPPGTAAAAASALSVAFPPKVAALHEMGLDREAELAFGELEGSWRVTHGGRANEALCRAYGRLTPAEREYRVGQRAATYRELNVAPSAGNRWLWECVYPRPYGDLVAAEAAAHGVEPELIYAVMRQESGFRPDVVSPADAVGLLQILPSTGERLARELELPFERARLSEPAFNVTLGTRYLKKLLDLFQGNLALAAASYNAGPNAVLRWVDGGRALDLDLFVARIPYAETRSYVERVVGNYARYRYLAASDPRVPGLGLALPEPRRDGVELY